MSATPNYPDDVLDAGGWPKTNANRRFLNDWHGAEESPCTNNPLNNWQGVAAESGIQTTPCFGRASVCINAPYCIANYANGADGSRGTANAIKRHAPDVAAMLATGQGYAALSQAAIDEISSWGTKSWAATLSPGQSPASGGGGSPTGPTGSGSGGGGSQPPSSRPRPGGTDQGSYESVIFGIPGTPDLPWQTIMSPLSIPGSFLGWAKDAFSSVTDLPGVLIQIGKTMLLAIKFFLWLLDPKHWVMILEVVFGAILILHALNGLSKLFSGPGDFFPKMTGGGSRRKSAGSSSGPVLRDFDAIPGRTRAAPQRRSGTVSRAIRNAAKAAAK